MRRLDKLIVDLQADQLMLLAALERSRKTAELGMIPAPIGRKVRAVAASVKQRQLASHSRP